MESAGTLPLSGTLRSLSSSTAATGGVDGVEDLRARLIGTPPWGKEICAVQTHSGQRTISYPAGSGHSPSLVATNHHITPERNQSNEWAVTHHCAHGLSGPDLARRLYHNRANKFLLANIPPGGTDSYETASFSIQITMSGSINPLSNTTDPLTRNGYILAFAR